MKAPKSNGKVPVFTKESFPRPEDNVYIHMSNEFPEFVGVPHSHEYIEIVYVISGSAIHEIGDQRITANKGDLFIVNCDVTHAFYSETDSKEPFCAYDLMFSPDFFDVDLVGGRDLSALGTSFLFYSMFPDEKALSADLHLSGTGYSDFGSLFNKIYLEYYGRELGYTNMIRAYVIELLIKIFRRMDSRPDSATAAKSQMIQKTLEYLRENYNMHISVSKLASDMFLSRDYFSKLFRDTTGKTVTAFLKEIRIGEACRMLRETDRKISDIAEYCGYSDMKHFYSAFHKQTGTTPGEYRKKR